MIKRIVLPVDGSEHATRAAAFAGDLASKYGSDIILLHVIDRDRIGEAEEHMAEIEYKAERGRGQPPWVANVPAELAAMLQTPETGQQKEQMAGYLADKVVHAATEKLEEHGVGEDHIRVLFKNGPPVKRILETIEDEGADLVVMGSRGLSNLSSALAGSVSHRIANLAPCSVVSVK